MSTFSTLALKEKLSRLSLSQDSIETLSLWVIHHKNHAKSTTEIWLEEMRKASADRRLILFYLANDILQNGRRRGADVFQELFQDPLREAVTLIGGQKIQTSVERMFRIWKERRLYNNKFLKELQMLIEPVRKAQVNEPLPDFKLSLLQDALSEFGKFEAELKVKSSHLANLRVDISNPTASLSMLKDKSAGGRVSSEFNEASQKLQDYCECLGIEVNERINILDMLKECKVFTAYRLTELQKTAADYKNLNLSIKDLKKKLDQRVKDLERAHSTATSDPSAKEDITDVGDMEIESDGESQDPQQQDHVTPTTTTITTTTNHSSPSLKGAPGMMFGPPSAAYPTQQQQQQQKQKSGVGPMAIQPSPRTPNMYRAQQPINQQFPRLRAPASGPNEGQRRPLSAPAHNQRPFSPRQRIALQPRGYNGPHSRLRPPHMGPPSGPRSPFRGPSESSNTKPHTISGAPVMYNSRGPNPSAPADGDKNDGPGDGRLSLDQRLKDLIVNKKFENSILNEHIDVNAEEKPYSPSASDSLITNNVAAEEMEEDKESLPTPTSDSPTEEEETSPRPNMDNPILQALYKSQASPEDKQPSSHDVSKSLVPAYNQIQDNADPEELSTKDLKNILKQVESVEGGNEAPAMDNNVVPSDTVGNKPVGGAAEIKITPTLTNLLDEIFPQLSKTLIDRKRKQGGDDNATKVPRLATDVSSRPPPRPQFMPRPYGSRPLHPHSLHGSRFPPPRPQFSPVRPPHNRSGENPRPFAHDGPRPLDKQMMENRFGPRGSQNFPMHPRMRAFHGTRLYRPPPPPGYRPMRPRYV